MKKEAHALRFNIYLNEDISFDEKTVYLYSEQEGYDSYEEGYNRTKNEYFNERRIQHKKEGDIPEDYGISFSFRHLS